MSESGHTESFPPASNLPSKFVPPAAEPSRPPARSRGESVASNLSLRVRRLSRSFEESNLPEGFFAATADIASSLIAGGGRMTPTAETRRPSFPIKRSESSTATMSNPTHERPDAGHNEATIMEDMNGSADANTTAPPSNSAGEQSESVPSHAPGVENKAAGSADDATLSTSRGTADSADAELCEPFDNGYHFPPKYSAKDSFRHGMIGFWKYFTTPLGFFVVIYGLNVVAWGGMLFLLLCNASPAMCYPACDDIDSPRRKWIEWDSQILNALFCVTGFGLAPWRIRDMYYLAKFRLFKQHIGLRRLAGIHRGWFRLAGSQDLPVEVGPDHIPDSVPRDAIPYPDNKIPTAPLTGRRAPPTKLWKMDFILWMNIWNTFFQCCLCGFMWGMDRYTRPSWSTGLFVALACTVGAIGGLGMFFEGKTVKGIEGVPLTDEDKEKLARDSDHGIQHYNNIKAKKPKEKEGDAEANTEKASKRARLGLGSKKGGK